MVPPFLLAVSAFNVLVGGGASLGGAILGPSREPTLSLAELFASRVRYDHGPIVVHARLQNMSPHAELLEDEGCQGACHNVIGFDIPDAITNRADVRSLSDARVDNDHSCFVKLRVKVIYKWPRPDAPLPPAGLRVSRLEIVDVLGLATRRLDGRVGRGFHPCPAW